MDGKCCHIFEYFLTVQIEVKFQLINGYMPLTDSTIYVL